MFDQILQIVKEHMDKNAGLAEAIPADDFNSACSEIATHISYALNKQADEQGGMNEILPVLLSGKAAGTPLVSSIESSLVNILSNKYELPPATTGAIAASLPELLEKFAYSIAGGNDTDKEK